MSLRSKVIRKNGCLKIDINGRIYDPLAFKSFRPNPQNVSEFYAAGVRLFSVLTSGVTSALGVPYSLYGESWIGENTYDFSAIDRQMDMFIENAPEAYFAPMIQLDTRDWYLESHDGIPNSFTHLSQIACDEEWKAAASDYMKAAILHIEEKYGDKVYGYFLLCGTTTEWFSDGDYEASHPIKERGYKNWLKDENAHLPSQERLDLAGDVFLSEDENDVYLARKFHSEIIADLILYFTNEAQSVIRHNKLLGLYYGYLFELGGERLYNAGSLGYEKVFLSDDIDMVSSPSSYGYRKLQDPSAFMVTQKTLDAHNKLYFLEFDHITHAAPTEIKDGRQENSSNMRTVKIPGADSKCKNEAESLNLMYRDFILCKANGAAMWWFDMFDGWFRTEGMMKAVKHMLKTDAALSTRPSDSVAEVAVFAEGEAMHRVRKSSNLATVCLSDIRRTLAECGAAYDLYSISDLTLEKTDNYKLYIFVNQYDISENRKKLISDRLSNNGKSVLWLYAPDYANGGKLSAENISKTTGITVTGDITSHGGIVYDGKITSYNVASPYFKITDNNATPIAYFEDGTIAVAYKDINGIKSIYVATCNLPSDLLREIAKLSGVFIYSSVNNVYVYPNSASTGIYNASGAEATIYLKQDGKYKDMISGDIYTCTNGKITLPYKDINAFLLVNVEEEE